VLVDEIRMVIPEHELIELEAGTLGKLDLRRRYDLLRELAESRNTTDELRKRVRTEQQVGAGDVVPDVAVDGEYYEVEELFGEGRFREFKKVQKTVEKYGGIQGKVTVVVEGLAAG